MDHSKPAFFLPTARAREAGDDVAASPAGAPTFGDVVAARFGRRDLLKGLLGVAAISATVSPLALAAGRAEAADELTRFPFPELTAAPDATIHVAEGHEAKVLISWGDPVLPGAPAFDPKAQTAAAQALQFGYNNDFVGFIPLGDGPDGAARGLLVVNHEYTNEELMFPGMVPQTPKNGFSGMTRELVDIEMAAHGGAVIEIRRGAEGWQVVPGSKYARRITAETPMALAGPAAGDARLKTHADPDGLSVKGMLNNCAGGITPWGTWLTCEENFNYYFSGTREGLPDAEALKRFGLPGNAFAWARHHDRFDMQKEPNEANRFGWVVEIDPFDPASTPRKRTAMGRFKHEGAAGIVNADGRYVAYQGDDQKMEHVYRFVTDARVDRADAAANRDILDAGTLAVAVFHADGSGEWRPLVQGEGPLTPEKGFATQADVLIHARLAASALGATRMDRPEDVEVNPQTGKVYVMLTANDTRTEAEVDGANPRAKNAFGHIVEITPKDGDHAGRAFTWEVLVRCGDPRVAEVGATFSPATSAHGWFANPDNCAVDHQGRLWVATDGNSHASTGRTDGVWGVETEGPGRGTAKRFFSVPIGAEMCGPYFTPDDATFFVAVQHPGESEDGRVSSFDDPSTRWPDFEDGMPPRPSVVAITRIGGGKVGT
ncbi:PhoX family protein [Xanthobacter pseudotagetidis]|uniref:PhoX family protein n=1 Tax=Xanthobacter pseudotagetidis TaxID=3119911 RepID=UPI003728C1D0